MRLHTERVPQLPCVSRGCRLDLDAPEPGVGFGEGDAHFPGFVAAPDDFAMCAAACFGEHQANLAAERHVSAYNGHAAGMADVNGESVRSAAGFAFIPFEAQTEAGGRARVRSHARPALFHHLKL